MPMATQMWETWGELRWKRNQSKKGRLSSLFALKIAYFFKFSKTYNHIKHCWESPMRNPCKWEAQQLHGESSSIHRTWEEILAERNQVATRSPVLSESGISPGIQNPEGKASRGGKVVDSFFDINLRVFWGIFWWRYLIGS